MTDDATPAEVGCNEGLGGEFAAFEVWAEDQGHRLEKHDTGCYLDLRTEGAWWAWQARAALAQRQQAQVPEGFVLVPVEFIEAGQRVAQEYARTNPKWPMWDNGEAEPKVQDPCGVHAWLEQAATLAAAPRPEAGAGWQPISTAPCSPPVLPPPETPMADITKQLADALRKLEQWVSEAADEDGASFDWHAINADEGAQARAALAAHDAEQAQQSELASILARLEAVPMKDLDLVRGEVGTASFVGWNACRAAMLAAAKGDTK
jgi:hypothetical protein